MGGTKLLTDQAHRDGSPSSRNHPDVVKKYMESGMVHAGNKHITSEIRKSSSTKKPRGAPMKLLLAQEMSKENESKRKQSNVVARLMGLDEPLPAHQSFLNGEGKLDKRGRTRSSQLKDGYFDRLTPCEVHSCTHMVKYRDVCEIHPKGRPLQKGACDEIQNERRMALVRQKFMEAKRLAMDEKLLRSKEFQDAVEVLSSNRDLFLKFLEEPKFLFSKHLKEVHSAPAAPQTKRITLLKPIKTLEVKGEGRWGEEQKGSSMIPSTRIVILKPSLVKRHDTKPMREDNDFWQVLEDTESVGSKEAGKDITQQIAESVSSIQRDESLLSSVLSTGYIGDESSFSKSENEYEREEDGNFSDSTQTSRHSWAHSNRFGSPYSLSSFSRASYSPEPSMIREAKKRLSERWSLVASNLNGQEQMEVQKSSSTLGEMLGVGGLTVSSGRSYDRNEDFRFSGVCSSSCQTNLGDDAGRYSLDLLRSKSVPASFSAYENIGLNSEVLDSQVKKPVVIKDASKSKKSGGLSFKGKVSSLFFSRKKKDGSEKSISSKLQVGSAELTGEGNDDDFLLPVCDSQPKTSSPLNSDEESFKGSVFIEEPSKQGTISLRAILSLEKPNISGTSSDNQHEVNSSNKINENEHQPSPSSVLDGPFGNDTSNNAPDSSENSSAQYSLAPIESVARTLSWDDTNNDSSTPDSLLSLVHNILAAAGLNNKNFNTMFSKWHSVDSPLDPIFLDKFLDRKENAKSRERRSNQRLVFDCVNSALLEAGRACIGARKKHLSSTSTEDEVCSVMRDWLFGEWKLESGETENNSPVVESLLRKEVGGSGWVESMQSEVDEISKEIGGEVLEDLVAEVLECLST